MAKRVMILATNGFEQSELFDPKQNLENAGIETELVSLESGEIKAWDKDDWGKPIARRIYAETRDSYHSYTRGRVDATLGMTAGE